MVTVKVRKATEVRGVGGKRRTCLHFPEGLYEDAWVLAVERRCKYNDVIVQALREYLERNPPRRKAPL